MASSSYTRDVLRVVVAQICQNMGWNSTQTTPLEVLTDLLSGYIHSLGTGSHKYGEQFGHTEPTIVDVDLVLKDLGVSVMELEEYVKFVKPVPCAVSVPKYPVKRESHLNLLKPGSREVLTRPVHIHEHLPAMHPELEGEPPPSVIITGSESAASSLSSPKNSLVKHLVEDVSEENDVVKRARIMLEEGQPLREISSVIMTTSGFLSPACEGKLPEATTPTQASDYPSGHPTVKGEKKSTESMTKYLKKLANKERSKTKDKHRSKSAQDDDPKKKLVNVKTKNKLNVLNPGLNKIKLPKNSMKKTNKHIIAPFLSARISSLPKIPKLNQKIPKNEHLKSVQSLGKSNNDKTKDPIVNGETLVLKSNDQNLNNFQKNFKEEEIFHDVKTDSDLEEESHQRCMSSETINVAIPKSSEEQESRENCESVDVESLDSELILDSLSLLGTPPRPLTPDLVPPQQKHVGSKHKKKRKRDRYKENSHSPVPKRFKSDSTELDYSLLEKPKTPEIELSNDDVASVFLKNIPRPGLIPSPPAANVLFNLTSDEQPANLALSDLFPSLAHTRLESSTCIDSTTTPLTIASPLLEAADTTIISPSRDKSFEKIKDREDKMEKKDKIKKKKEKKEKKGMRTSKQMKVKIKYKNIEDKNKKKKEKEFQRDEKKKDEGSIPKLTLKLGPPSPQPAVPERTCCKIIIKPIEPPKEVKQEKRFPKLELTRISIPVTRPSVSVGTKPSATPLFIPSIPLNLPEQARNQAPDIKEQANSEKKEPLAFYFDEEGRQVWICPACGAQDDGSPMIGCDSCDAWYHWVCVGIQAPPDSNDWFCRVCIKKKQRKKKKKDKKKKTDC